MKYCIYCGQELNDEAVYCTKCGKKQTEEKPNIEKVVTKKETTGVGFGVTAICTFFIPVLPLIFGSIGIYFGIKNKNTGALVCSIIGIVLGVLTFIASIIVSILFWPVYLEWLHNMGQEYIAQMANLFIYK